MGQAASQIENHIENKREDLGSNLRELESKVKSAADWRYQFRNKPMVFLGAAFGGGAVLASMFGRPSGRRYYSNYSSGPRTDGSDGSPRRKREPSPTVEKAYEAWENMKGALIGVAVTKAKDYADGVIPGFSEQYRQSEAKHNQHP
jgi:hypothetical protein